MEKEIFAVPNGISRYQKYDLYTRNEDKPFQLSVTWKTANSIARKENAILRLSTPASSSAYKSQKGATDE